MQNSNNPMYGRVHSAETKEKIRLKAKNRTLSLETRQKIGFKIKGRIVSAETREKMRLSMLGKNKGKKASIETKLKMSKTRIGKNLNNKFGLGNKSHLGLKQSNDTKSKISKSLGGTGIPYELSEYGKEFDSALKEQVRFKDGYKCQECGCTQLENIRQLDVHHIDYDKKNNNINNLIALCRKCHMHTNFNRGDWQEHFSEKSEAERFAIDSSRGNL
jgi:hypothetical protein